MRTAQDLMMEWSSIKSNRARKTEKVAKVLAVRSGISAIEMAALRDMTFPFYEVQKARDLLIDIDEWLKGAGHPQVTA